MIHDLLKGAKFVGGLPRIQSAQRSTHSKARPQAEGLWHHEFRACRAGLVAGTKTSGLEVSTLLCAHRK